MELSISQNLLLILIPNGKHLPSTWQPLQDIVVGVEVSKEVCVVWIVGVVVGWFVVPTVVGKVV